MEKIRVLIAEDAEPIARLYAKMLPSNVFELSFAANGQEAIEQYAKVQPDIIVLDIMMPVKTGYSVLKELREDLGDTKTAVVMATSKDQEEDVMACAKLGIQGYLVKPFKPMRVIRQLVEVYTEQHPNLAPEILKRLQVEES